MDELSHAILGSGSWGLFAYGVLNRALIITGLDHILNNLAWFLLGDFHGVTGDLKRFFAGDPTAGAFMSGFFPVMMFGLPGACLAMYHAARPERRRVVGGLLLSIGLTSLLTGVTEPIEFTFMFLAPPLYAVHALLTGLAMVIMESAGVHLGFSFSAGLFDYVLNFSKATRPLWLVPIGPVYFGLYYGPFRYGITRFKLTTPGREVEVQGPATAPTDLSREGRADAFIAALGGAANLTTVDACTTRLRLVLADGTRVDAPVLARLGACGLVRPASNAVLVVLGPIADQVAGEMRRRLKLTPAAPGVAAKAAVAEGVAIPAAALIGALGGAANVRTVEAAAGRLLLSVGDAGAFDRAALERLGVRASRGRRRVACSCWSAAAPRRAAGHSSPPGSRVPSREARSGSASDSSERRVLHCRSVAPGGWSFGSRGPRAPRRARLDRQLGRAPSRVRGL